VDLLYANYLILVAASKECLCEKIVQWKSGLEAKGLKTNTGKTKEIFGYTMKDSYEEKGK